MSGRLPRIFCSIDTVDLDRALALAAAMQRAECGIKLGLEFFNALGPEGVKDIRRTYPDLPLFLDLKFHDIPNTVASAASAVCALEPAYINVHASGGRAMMTAAREALYEATARHGVRRPSLLGVTVLTSLSDEELTETGFADTAGGIVKRLAALSRDSGLDGVVCSGHEIETVRRACGDSFILMVPGIRPEGSDTGDQKRIMTPLQALKAGATHLVIGRPITASGDPYGAARVILDSIDTESI